MLWVKALHIVFVASWFAGLLYLPRIFVNLAMVPDGSAAERERLLLMATKLYRFTAALSWPLPPPRPSDGDGAAPFEGQCPRRLRGSAGLLAA